MDRCEYIGIVSPIDFLQSCDIVVAPSRSETGSIAVLEAMAAGRLVVASNIDPHNAYIESGCDGLLFNSLEQFRSALDKALSNPEGIRLVGTRARNSANRYSWANLLPKFEGMYKDVIAAAGRLHSVPPEGMT